MNTSKGTERRWFHLLNVITNIIIQTFFYIKCFLCTCATVDHQFSINNKLLYKILYKNYYYI